MESDPYYNYYLVAFIDLMGQKKAFEKIIGVPKTKEEQDALVWTLANTVGFIGKFRQQFRDFAKQLPVKEEFASKLNPEQLKTFECLRKVTIGFQTVSDSVIAYVSLHKSDEDFACSAMNGIYNVLFATCSIVLGALANSHPCRGGIEIDGGTVYHPGEIYGPALNKAYFLESDKTQADYPRILIGEGLIKYLQAVTLMQGDNPYVNQSRQMAWICQSFIAIDADGKPILDYIGKGMRAHAESLLDKQLQSMAYNFVCNELKRFSEEQDLILAPRYVKLKAYFDSRLPLWGMTPR